MRRKKTSLTLWYFYFGISAVFVIIGFFWIFSYLAATPHYIASSVNESIKNQSSTLVINKPPFPYTAAFLAVFGIATFLITKYFYDKEGYHVKRTRKHG